jgi:succinate dehydrogenase cytochrome b556 subunit
VQLGEVDLTFILLLGKEAIIGLVLGYVAAIPFWTMEAIGFVVDNQRGASMAATVNPMTGHDTSPLGMLVLFGATWSLAYHFFNGLRHLAWDLGYGFDKKLAERNSVIIFALSALSAIAIFAIVWTGHGGYLQ